LMKKDGNIINLANIMKADWLRACNAARVSDHLTQNDMDAILDEMGAKWQTLNAS
jgi:hypothetical protein